ncbi:hypothetical protein EUGRSUZ_G01010 [Eucalyptus grandis]|uniref:Uncharacterized protein n=2 Tax=Eucalyptus grandis TaxID=71139 RepID=A0ACC3K1J0_EUCGR|nr:hypothetical protein EUGRSUZ_G01010 [Eucalyptus grandis]
MVFVLSLSIPSANSESFDNISFNFPSLSNDERITFQGNASVLNSIIQLTLGVPSDRPTRTVGRAIYHQPMYLWDSSTGNVADFVNQFTFAINFHMSYSHADGLVFFLAPNGSPEYSEGRFLGLTSSQTLPTLVLHLLRLASVSNTCVSWMNEKIILGQQLRAQVIYNSRALNLSVYLPEWVVFGFSAMTGLLFEAHTIFSWEFNSSLRILDNVNGTTNVTTIDTPRQRKKSKFWVKGPILGLSSLVFLILVAGFGWYAYKLQRNKNDRILAVATNDFANTRLLGKGGFGGAYEGHLADANSHVSIEKITPNSKQGVKEYATELVSWCHEGNKFLLVYEYMSNGSLDSHLFKGNVLLIWERSYNVAQSIALALKNLHEDLK